MSHTLTHSHQRTDDDATHLASHCSIRPRTAPVCNKHSTSPSRLRFKPVLSWLRKKGASHQRALGWFLTCLEWDFGSIYSANSHLMRIWLWNWFFSGSILGRPYRNWVIFFSIFLTKFQQYWSWIGVEIKHRNSGRILEFVGKDGISCDTVQHFVKMLVLDFSINLESIILRAKRNLVKSAVSKGALLSINAF